MTWDEFVPQMQRLRTQWPNFYGDERTKVVFGWVSRLSASWWARQVDYQLGHHADTHRGPLSEIESAAMRERERQWEAMRRKEHTDARAFFEATAMPEEVRKRLAKIGLYRMPEGGGES